MTSRIYLSNTFKLVRESLGLTMGELGIKLDVTKATICLWESGKRLPKTEILLWYLEQSKDVGCQKVDCLHCGGTGKINLFGFRNGVTE
jgi:DNA-binding XRE family transcriptional regulator